jgi:hypothetical protein
MAEWDSEKGKLRPTWKVRFTPFMTFVGSAVAGVLTALVLFLQVITGPGLDELNSSASVFQGVLLLFGALFLIFLILGPTLAWGLGFTLRNVTNQSLHVLAFAALGLVVGSLLGPVLGIGALLAPAAGIGTGLARWFMSPFAKLA